MKKHWMLACASALILVAGAAAAQQAQPATPAQPAPASKAKFVPPIRGQAELGFTKPVTKRVKDEIVTTIKVKNMSTTGAIAGLKVEEYWYDKAGDPVTGDRFMYRKPLLPQEIIEVTLRTPVNPKMDRNQYNFSHANGTIKTVSVPKL